jgi:hypothetical protein
VNETTKCGQKEGDHGGMDSGEYRGGLDDPRGCQELIATERRYGDAGMSTIESVVPEKNLKIYRRIYTIEIVLRELIISALGEVRGELWHIDMLPPDILRKYLNAKEYEEAENWNQLVPHHPIYYIDFSHLRIIIEAKKNWNAVFKGIFKKSLNGVQSRLSALEPIRNKIAHNRLTSDKDFEVVEVTFEWLSECLGEQRVLDLATRMTLARDIPGQIGELRAEALTVVAACTRCAALESLATWQSIGNSWWFDQAYLGHPVDRIVIFFETAEEYHAIPRRRGSGHHIEAWVRKSQIEDKYEDAEKDFTRILKAGG